jgi:hypothetical protein
VNLVELLSQDYYSATLGGFGVVTNTWQQAYPLLGLAAAGELVTTTVPAAIQTLQDLQEIDGGWKYDQTGAVWNTTSADNTGLALPALIAAGVANDGANRDRRPRLSARLPRYWPVAGTMANSTAFAIQGCWRRVRISRRRLDRQRPRADPALAAYQKADGPLCGNGASPRPTTCWPRRRPCRRYWAVAFPADTGVLVRGSTDLRRPTPTARVPS